MSIDAVVPIRRTLADDWCWWLPTAVLAFMLGSILTTGWPAGLLPSFTHPLVYQGDGLAYSWLIQRVLEGWAFENERSGYPFGSNFLDYPGSDAGSLVIVKLLGLVFGGYVPALNLYYLLTYPAAFLTAFLSLRALHLNRPMALAAALLYAFIPSRRLGHLFLSCYFVAPIYFYFAFRIYLEPGWLRLPLAEPRRLMGVGLALVVCASFGVYFAAFGVIVLATAAIAGALAHRDLRSLARGALLCAIVSIGVLGNVAPSILYQNEHGRNVEVANRLPIESENLGLKLIQMISPRHGHRSDALAAVTLRYEYGRPPSESRMAAMGIVGSAGLLVMLVGLFAGAVGRPVDRRLGLFTVLGATLFLFGTVGGLGTVFAYWISPMLRGWNRISSFINYAALAALFLAMQLAVRARPGRFGRRAAWTVSALIAAIGIWDQTMPVCDPCIARNRKAFDMDRQFTAAIEAALPVGSAIFQYPYVQFPEVPAAHELPTYEQLAGYLHSTALKWSYAGMKGRPGDYFYRALSQEPLAEQLPILRRLGFAGLTVDRRGYADRGDVMIESISQLLGRKPDLAREDGAIVFFRFDQPVGPSLLGLPPDEIMRRVGYFADALGPRYAATLDEGIEFSRSRWPEFIKTVAGISGNESWGRWSDANLAPCVRLEFFKALPDRFDLLLTMSAFGPNAGREFVVIVGANEYRGVAGAAAGEVRIPVANNGSVADVIQICPPSPVQPEGTGSRKDRRRIGLGLIRLRITHDRD